MSTPPKPKEKPVLKASHGLGPDETIDLEMDGFVAEFAQPQPQEPALGSRPNPLRSADLTDRHWRAHAMARREIIPAGYTYLGQLIGHDLGHSVPIAEIPYVQNMRAVRYNIIENPLSLETLYGAGPRSGLHVFDPETWRFRIGAHATVSQRLIPGDVTVRALHDIRNRDSLMLHQIATLWMRYHNAVAARIETHMTAQMTAPPRTDPARRKLAQEVYVAARGHVLASWHAVIEHDFMARLLHPVAAGMSRADLAVFDDIDDTTLLHGLFRVFHAMPRSAYRVAGVQRLRDLLAPLPDTSMGEKERWAFDLHHFFSDLSPHGTKTGVSASIAPALSHISMRDFKSAVDTSPLQLGSLTVQSFAQKLPGDWPERVSAVALSQQINAELAQVMPGASLSQRDVAHGPLYIALMIEAHVHGQSGGLGPLASVIFRRAISARMAEVRYRPIQPEIYGLSVPRTMLDLIAMT